MTGLTFHVERDLGPFDQREYVLDATYQINPYYAATHLQPAEGGDCEIVSVMHDGEDFDLTQSEENALQLACLEDAEKRAGYESDYCYEKMRDRQMTDEWERNQ